MTVDKIGGKASEMSDPKTRTLPVLIVKTGTMSAEDKKRCENRGFLLVVECAEPDSVRFMQSPPDSTIPEQAQAALKLMRLIFEKEKYLSYNCGELATWWAKVLMEGSQPKPTNRVKP